MLSRTRFPHYPQVTRHLTLPMGFSCLCVALAAAVSLLTAPAQAQDEPAAESKDDLGSGLDRILAEEMAEALAPDPGSTAIPAEADDEQTLPELAPELETLGGRLHDPQAPQPPGDPLHDDFWVNPAPGEALQLFDDRGILDDPDPAPTPYPAEDPLLTEQVDLPEDFENPPPAQDLNMALQEQPDAAADATRPRQERLPDSEWGLQPRIDLEQYQTFPLELALQRLTLFLTAEQLEPGLRQPLDPHGLTLLPDPLALPVRPDDYLVEPGWDDFLQEIPPPTQQEIANQRLVGIARQVAPAVLALRAYDEFGEELASGCGFFISDEGLVMTDVQLVHPELADRIEYITARTGDGRNYRISGFWFADTANGFVVLQADARQTPSLPLKDVRNFPELMEVAVLSLPENRGLTLAEARLSIDPFLSGEGWLRLTGNDSPGVPGSPVLNPEGHVIAIVALQVPEKNWMNFALPAPNFAAVYDVLPPEPKPLSQLAAYRYDLVRDSQFVAAVENLLARQYTMATRRLLRIVERYPRSAEAWGVLGLACTRMGATDEAINCHRRALAIDPDASQVWYQLSVNYLSDDNVNLPQLRATQQALQKTVDNRPADKLAWLLLAETWLRLGEFSQAAEALSWVIRLEPDLPRVHYLLAVARGKMDQTDAALEAVQQSLALNSRNPRAWFYRGLIHDSRKEFQLAAEAYQKTVDLEPNHPNAWMNLAHALRRNNQMTPARRAFRQHFKVEKTLAQNSEEIPKN